MYHVLAKIRTFKSTLTADQKVADGGGAKLTVISPIAVTAEMTLLV